MSANQPAVFVHTPRAGVVNTQQPTLREYTANRGQRSVTTVDGEAFGTLWTEVRSAAGSHSTIYQDLTPAELRNLARSLIDAAHYLDTCQAAALELQEVAA